MPKVDLARRFDLTPAAVSCAVQRGEKVDILDHFRLIFSISPDKVLGVFADLFRRIFCLRPSGRRGQK